MSALFNQTNISPGTAFASSGGGGGGSNFPTGFTIGTTLPATFSHGNQTVFCNESISINVGDSSAKSVLDNDLLKFQQGTTNTDCVVLSYDNTKNMVNLSNVGLVNGSAPLVFRTADTPTPVNMLVQAGRTSYTGAPTPVTLPVPYSNYMFIQVTQTGNDSVPDGVMYYTNSNLSDFTVLSTGSNANVEFIWTAFGW